MAVWIPTMLRCSIEWSLNPQYYYGWAVPLLAAYLAFERLGELPAPQATERQGWVIGLILLAALPFLPLRWLGEANSISRLVSWAMGLQALGISIGILYLVGGRRWVSVMLGAILFLLVAIPWPQPIEQPVVQGLMRTNASAAAEIVSAAGIPAEARGNVIEVPTGVLGVNEACSGIRSLQSTLMAAIFLGLLYRCSRSGVVILVGAGAGIALGCNLVRTTFLAWEGASHGIEATEKWHDSAGFAILGVVLVCLWLLSQFLEKHAARSSARSAPALSTE
jgi:exosortase